MDIQEFYLYMFIRDLTLSIKLASNVNFRAMKTFKRKKMGQTGKQKLNTMYGRIDV